MNAFIFLGCVPVSEWQHKIDFVTKTVLDKENTYILVRKKKYILPPQRTPLRVFGVKKVAVLRAGGSCTFPYKPFRILPYCESYQVVTVYPIRTLLH